ncbi:cytochrome c oxidase biogenesis [Fusarium beomiforme]|uniref:Cytochrome c oxidase biogenesis n=1 Tax=Fusarium beomiforme TaxID=44412 RepID=A0A9P5ANH7_9HYPO|nr:cytochrome c oxidase biogenesis [Fusarium beomiforme]
MAVQNPPVPGEKLGVPSRNPLPLSASQEAQVRDIFYQKVRKECAEEIKGTFPAATSTTITKLQYQAILTNPSIRRMRSRTHIHRLLRLPRRTPLHEQLHEAARHTIRPRRGTRGMVRLTNRAPEGT